MRLAVKTGAWVPTPHEWRTAADILEACEPSEMARILRLRIEDDRKRSLTGRLLLRHAFSVHLGVPHRQVRLERSAQNKPVCADATSVNVNVSHHGDWVVLASDAVRQVGVDVMKFEEPRRGRDVFFTSMKRQFTEQEWTSIDTSLERFYTYWALKESYIKGVGIGLGFNLQRANFLVKDGLKAADVEIDGALDRNWEFSLSSLDPMHVVAVALGPPRPFEAVSTDAPAFQTLDFSQLLAFYDEGSKSE